MYSILDHGTARTTVVSCFNDTYGDNEESEIMQTCRVNFVAELTPDGWSSDVTVRTYFRFLQTKEYILVTIVDRHNIDS